MKVLKIILLTQTGQQQQLGTVCQKANGKTHPDCEE